MRALYARFPALARALAHVDLGVRETPVEQFTVDGVTLLIKRDDRTTDALGGNKVRALELLLAGLKAGDTLLTVGARGSTHALAAAQYGQQRGAACEVITWPQEMNEVAHATARRLERSARVTHATSVADAYLRAALRRMRGGRRWIPAGGSVPLGALGHVAAALELVAQLERDGTPMPSEIVVPLGSGGTIAGLLVGLAIARADTRVVGVRVVPALVANHRHVRRLARGTHALVAHLAGTTLPRLDASRLQIVHDAFGGAYGRETAEATIAARQLAAAGGPRLDGTYSAKAFGVALERARAAPDGGILFWLTFDGRWLDAGNEAG